MMLCIAESDSAGIGGRSLRRSPHPSVPVGATALLRPWLLSDADAAVEAFGDRAENSLMGRVSLKGVDLHDGSAGVALHADGWHDMHQHALLASQAGIGEVV
jgi:[ribosomal protein S5]-alanine N-acetyltransferase